MGEHAMLSGLGSCQGYTHPSFTSDFSPKVLPPHPLPRIIGVQLSGQYIKSDPADMYCPQVRRSPLSFDNGAVKHIDVVACWKGITLGQASELLMWEHFHHDALVSQVSRELRSMENLSYSSTRLVPIDVRRLVYDMIDMWYKRTKFSEGPKSWFVDTLDLPSMVFNFIRTQDYYLNDGPRCYVQVDIDCTVSDSQMESQLKVLATVNWHPPTVEFAALPRSLSSGEKYRIKPEYIPSSLGCPTFSVLHPEVKFSAGSNKMSFGWDASRRCFKATVPSMTTNEVLHLESTSREDPRVHQYLSDLNKDSPRTSNAITTLTAFASMAFADGVHFERETRYDIKLVIIEPEPEPVHIPTNGDERQHHPQLPFRFSASPKDTPRSDSTVGIADPNIGSCIASRPAAPDTPAPSPRWQPSLTATPDGSHSSNSDADADDDADDDAWVNNIFGNCGTAQGFGNITAQAAQLNSETNWAKKLDDMAKHRKSRAYEARLGDSKVMPSLRKKGRVKRMVFPRFLMAADPVITNGNGHSAADSADSDIANEHSAADSTDSDIINWYSAAANPKNKAAVHSFDPLSGTRAEYHKISAVNRRTTKYDMAESPNDDNAAANPENEPVVYYFDPVIGTRVEHHKIPAFKRPTPVYSTAEESSNGDDNAALSPLDQTKIQDNFTEFLRGGGSSVGKDSKVSGYPINAEEEEEEQEFERIFMETE